MTRVGGHLERLAILEELAEARQRCASDEVLRQIRRKLWAFWLDRVVEQN